jgi:hypothetical protein
MKIGKVPFCFNIRKRNDDLKSIVGDSLWSLRTLDLNVSQPMIVRLIDIINMI